jgi:hypothetical protein
MSDDYALLKMILCVSLTVILALLWYLVVI